ncbi:type IV secretion system protein [Actinocatenispora comari]|uniref:Type IV secretion system protein n=1 Tax=Actinocatenispora comari TaxID=2807577 RepID=A0A8J4EHX9_9ACTN|nr:type IV secretion system protein [Actinocatenispora comari]GIL25507.1 hypothetical protein NUM_07620 [Actinocatenispora comari]
MPSNVNGPMVNAMMTVVMQWLAGHLIKPLLDTLFALLKATSFSSPDVTVMPAVQHMVGKTTWIVASAYVLAFVTAGIIAMCRDSLQVRHSAASLAPRLVVGLVASVMSQKLLSGVIEITNALVAQLTGDKITGGKAAEQLAQTARDSLNTTGAVLGLLLAISLAVFCIAALLTYLVRLGVLVLAAGLAPLALACLALPQTESVARLWGRIVAGCLIVQVLQSLLITMALQILTDPKANEHLQINTPTANASQVMNVLMVLVVLWGAVRIPTLVSRAVLGTTGSGGSLAGTAMRVVVVNTVGRGFTMLRRAGTATAAASGARTVSRAPQATTTTTRRPATRAPHIPTGKRP